jgi:hypothetical protein
MEGMKRQRPDQSGFIPLLVAILVIVLVIIYVAYTKVLHSH